MIHVVPKVRVTLHNNKTLEGNMLFYSAEHQLIKIDTLNVYIPFETVQELEFLMPEKETRFQFYYSKAPNLEESGSSNERPG